MVAESISQTICDVIRHWAERNPHKPAFIAEGQTPLTYGALTQLMDNFRETLNASGFGRGDRIGIVHPGGAAQDFIAGVGLKPLPAKVPFGVGCGSLAGPKAPCGKIWASSQLVIRLL